MRDVEDLWTFERCLRYGRLLMAWVDREDVTADSNAMYVVMRNALRVFERDEDAQSIPAAQRTALRTVLRKVLHECLDERTRSGCALRIRAAYRWFCAHRRNMTHHPLPSSKAIRFPVVCREDEIGDTVTESDMEEEVAEGPLRQVYGSYASRCWSTRENSETLKRRVVVDEIDRCAREVAKCKALGVPASEAHLSHALMPITLAIERTRRSKAPTPRAKMDATPKGRRRHGDACV